MNGRTYSKNNWTLRRSDLSVRVQSWRENALIQSLGCSRCDSQQMNYLVLIVTDISGQTGLKFHVNFTLVTINGDKLTQNKCQMWHKGPLLAIRY